MPTTLTIAILTLNEAQRIAACVGSASFANQVLVVDSGSSDGTQEIARTLGAEVVEYPNWQGFGEQRGRALTHVNSDYIFFLDADEVITAALQAEIQSAIDSNVDAIWKVVWTQVAFGRPLTLMAHSGGVARMFKTGSLLRFDGAVHERAITATALPTRIFKARLPHYSRETVYGSLLKLAQYVQLGAAKRAKAGKRGGILHGMASALSIFIKNYFFRRAFLCGAEGFLHCYLLAQECFFRYAALAYDKHATEFLSKRQNMPVSPPKES
jgi:glycosyltransferase involved in cell wall biosynthesis